MIVRGRPGRGSSTSPSKPVVHEPRDATCRPSPADTRSPAATATFGLPVRARQHDPRALRQRLRALRPARPRHKLLTLGLAEHQLRLRTTGSSHAANPTPLTRRTSNSGHSPAPVVGDPVHAVTIPVGRDTLRPEEREMGQSDTNLAIAQLRPGADDHPVDVSSFVIGSRWWCGSASWSSSGWRSRSSSSSTERPASPSKRSRSRRSPAPTERPMTRTASRRSRWTPATRDAHAAASTALRAALAGAVALDAGRTPTGQSAPGADLGLPGRGGQGSAQRSQRTRRPGGNRHLGCRGRRGCARASSSASARTRASAASSRSAASGSRWRSSSSARCGGCCASSADVWMQRACRSCLA